MGGAPEQGGQLEGVGWLMGCCSGPKSHKGHKWRVHCRRWMEKRVVGVSFMDLQGFSGDR